MASHHRDNKTALSKTSFEDLLRTPAFSLHLTVHSPGNQTRDSDQKSLVTLLRLCVIPKAACFGTAAVIPKALQMQVTEAVLPPLCREGTTSGPSGVRIPGGRAGNAAPQRNQPLYVNRLLG